MSTEKSIQDQIVEIIFDPDRTDRVLRSHNGKLFLTDDRTSTGPKLIIARMYDDFSDEEAFLHAGALIDEFFDAVNDDENWESREAESLLDS